MLSSSSHSTIVFITSGSLLLILAQLCLVSGGSCPTAPTITLAQYNKIKAGTTVSQMQTILGGLGYLQSLEYADSMSASMNSLTYTYQGTNQLPATAGISGQIASYGTFTFTTSTQQLKYKIQYGLC